MKDFYGDEVRFFIGEVIDHSPPFGLEGRVKVRIHGIHSPSTLDIRQSELPWAQVLIPGTEAGVSGLGRYTGLHSGALCFGIFMDGKDSQIPLILGSISRKEFPSEIQRFGVIYDERRIEDYFNKIKNDLLPNTSITENTNTGEISETTRQHRISEAFKFFLSSGYTSKQSAAIVSNIDSSSRMVTGGQGLALWTGQRFNDLKKFSNEWKLFTTQLLFILYELNGTQTNSNIFLLQSNSLNDKTFGCQVIFAKKYLKLKTISDVRFNRAIELHDSLI